MNTLNKYKVEVYYKNGVEEHLGEGLKKDIEDLGIFGVEKVFLAQAYQIAGDLSLEQIETICQKLLTDPVVQEYRIFSNENPPISPFTKGGFDSPALQKGGKGGFNDFPFIEIWYKKGVTDAVGESVQLGIHDLGIDKIAEVRTGQKYIFPGKIGKEELEKIAQGLLANTIVNEYIVV